MTAVWQAMYRLTTSRLRRSPISMLLSRRSSAGSTTEPSGGCTQIHREDKGAPG